MGRGADRGGSTGNRKGEDMKLVTEKEAPAADEVIVQFQTKSGNTFQMNYGAMPYVTVVEMVRRWMTDRVLIDNTTEKSSGMLWSDQIDTVVVVMRSEIERAQARAMLAGRR